LASQIPVFMGADFFYFLDKILAFFPTLRGPAMIRVLEYSLLRFSALELQILQSFESIFES